MSNLSSDNLHLENIEYDEDNEEDDSGLFIIANIIFSQYINIKEDPTLYQIYKLIAEKIIIISKEKIVKNNENNMKKLLKKLIELINDSTDLSSFFIFPGKEICYISYIISNNFIENSKDKNVNSLGDFYYKFDITPKIKTIKNKTAKSSENLSLIHNDSDNNNNINNIHPDMLSIFHFMKSDGLFDNNNNNSYFLNNDKKNKVEKRKNIKQIKVENFKFLISLLSTKRKFSIIFPNFELNKLGFLSYLFIQYSYNWLFSKINEFEINLVNNNIYAHFLEENEYNEKTIYKRVCNQLDFYYLIILIFYILGRVNKSYIENFILIIPYSYTTEINLIIKKNKSFSEIDPEETYIHLLHFIDYQFVNMKSITLEFNCLENLTFQNINLFLDKNIQITNLNISLFPLTNANILLSINQLKKFSLAEINENNIKIDMEVFNAQHEADYYLNFLYKSFQINFDIFFRSLSRNSMNLNTFHLNIDMPFYLSLNTQFCEIVIQFIFRLFKLIESNICHIVNLEIEATNFLFDGAKFVNITENIDECRMENSMRLKYFSFNMKIFNIDNFGYLLPRKVKKLILGEMDIDTFTWFIEDIRLLRSLEFLSFSLWNGKFELEQNYEILKKFTSGKLFPEKLKEIKLKTDIFLNFEMIENIINDKLIGLNYLESLYISFSYEKIICNNKNKYSKIEMQNIINKLINDNKDNIKSYKLISHQQIQTILKVLIKKHIITCHDYSKDLHEVIGYDDRKTILLIFKYLNNLQNKNIKLSII